MFVLHPLINKVSAKIGFFSLKKQKFKIQSCFEYDYVVSNLRLGIWDLILGT